MTDKRTNAHQGASFDELLKEQGIVDEVHAKAQQRALTDHDAPAHYDVRAERCDTKLGIKLVDKLDRFSSKKH